MRNLLEFHNCFLQTVTKDGVVIDDDSMGEFHEKFHHISNLKSEHFDQYEVENNGEKIEQGYWDNLKKSSKRGRRRV